VRGKLTPLRCVPLAKSHSQAVKNKQKNTKKRKLQTYTPWEWQQKLQKIAKNRGLIFFYSYNN
jgi:sialic acid synthase SpsE